MPRPRLLRVFVFRVLRGSGVPWLLRHVAQRQRLTILVYHDPSPATFARHLRLLRRLYAITSLRTAVDAHARGESLPPRPLVVTLDDGHRGNSALLEVVEELAVPVTIFLCSSIVGTARRFWFRHVPDAEELKPVDDDERLRRLEARGFAEDDEKEPREALSAGEIRELADAGVDLQSHGRTHALLPHCSDEKARSEIAGSRTDLAERFGLDVYAFAYPNGDYGDREVSYVEQAGYRCALTVGRGSNSRDASAYRLVRLVIDDDDGLDELVVKASGLWAVLRGRRRG